MGRQIRVAAVQAAPVFLDLDATVDKAIALMDEAGAKGVELIGFPETWIPGYPFWIWLDSPAWGMRLIGRYHDNSPEPGGRHDKALADAARRNRLTAVVGLSERDRGSLYLAQWIYGPEGEVIARRRKLKPTHVERTVFGESDGSHIRVYDTPLGRLGGLCCWEHLQPLLKYAMYSQGEEIHVASWPAFSLYEGMAYALGPELNSAASQMYAAEGQCFVVASCAVVDERMIEICCDTDQKRQMLRPGGGHARIFGPDGAPVVPPLAPDAEGLLVADIDLSAITYAKTAADPVGHYARPDVFRLMFNDRPAPKVMRFADAADLTAPGDVPAPPLPPRDGDTIRL
jgi:aliphatic nitrilase